MQLPPEEWIEQAHLFQRLGERTEQAMASQEILASIKEEILATTKLPMAIDFMTSELFMHGVMAPAMAQLSHYFTPFQTFVMATAEDDQGQFDLNVGLEILRREAEYRAGEPTSPGVFLFQFESICRNRLPYDAGLQAVAEDPIFDTDWHDWVLNVRRQIGLVDLSDLIYVRSQYYCIRRASERPETVEQDAKILFEEREGRIAWANRNKNPLLLFSALQRQLGYPKVPRLKTTESDQESIGPLTRRIERLEIRLKLLEEEAKGGIDIERYYGPAKDTDPFARNPSKKQEDDSPPDWLGG